MYKGRFAPSSTGPLHFGSLIAALASYLEAKSQQGQWHIRIDDLDHYRCKPEHTKSILNSLERLGFEWDGEIVYQSKKKQRYDEAIDQLRDHLFACTCSRKQLPSGPYPGTCSDNPFNLEEDHSLRLHLESEPIVFHDHLQGEISQNITLEVGDFIILRRDGVIAYHLATVIDDADSGFTHIVRGIDLMDSTPRQIYLQQLLHLPQPAYYHLPVAVDKQGNKLSKQNFAKAVDDSEVSLLLTKALTFLNHAPETGLHGEAPSVILKWAIDNWDINKLPAAEKIQVDEIFYG